ncbi:DUF4168 domain-containing protein [Echinicola jeungdonensis]|uniref:DUF4168 domain-containing protein n=1 Tax=Echinicola jeungdonensis TaxID=709343 RepID=A0ABV5J3K3_9BACT|nr:DUF4168 domain-containing protein [Echinicola jeungdonensis]MDN3668602.1 DUF4168 domain-containing protein [Echinicola jeungdonensis]
MTYLKELKVISLFSVLMICMVGLPVMAQQASLEVNEDFTDEEYQKFVKINTEIIPVQQEVQGKMMKVIQEEGLDIKRFQELAQAQQTGGLKDASSNAEELAKFNKAGQRVMKMQKEVQTLVQEVITNNELSLQKFQEISLAYNQSDKVRKKIDDLIKKEMEKE